jgi:hypothetical protein
VDVSIGTVLLTIISNVLILSVTLYAQARRERTQFERAQRIARLERVRAAYHLALEGDLALLKIVSVASWSLGPFENALVRAEQQVEEGERAHDMLNRAWIELTLENVNLDAINLNVDILAGYYAFRAMVKERYPDASNPVPFEELKAMTGGLRASTDRRKEAIQAHLGELEAHAQQRRSWRNGVKRPDMPSE